MNALPRILVALAALIGLSLAYTHSCQAHGPEQTSFQKGYGAKQKGMTSYGFGYVHRHHICKPPPDGPLLQSIAILRVAGPPPDIRFSVRQESGSAESAEEEALSEIERLKLRMEALEERFDLLFKSVDKLVDKLQPAE